MTEQEQIAEMAVLGCVRNPKAHTAEECAKCDFKQGMCNAYRHAETLYNADYQKVLIDTEDGKMVDCVQYAPWQLIEGYTEREVEKARKDTAKAILNVLYFNLQSSVKGHIAKSNVYYNVMNRIQEIAKNYGVEIEE